MDNFSKLVLWKSPSMKSTQFLANMQNTQYLDPIHHFRSIGPEVTLCGGSWDCQPPYGVLRHMLIHLALLHYRKVLCCGWGGGGSGLMDTEKLWGCQKREATICALGDAVTLHHQVWWQEQRERVVRIREGLLRKSETMKEATSFQVYLTATFPKQHWDTHTQLDADTNKHIDREIHNTDCVNVHTACSWLTLYLHVWAQMKEQRTCWQFFIDIQYSVCV